MMYWLNGPNNSYHLNVGRCKITISLLYVIFSFLEIKYFICDIKSKADAHIIVLGHYLLKSVELSFLHCTAKWAFSLYPQNRLICFCRGCFQPVATNPTVNKNIQPMHDFIQIYVLVKQIIVFARKWGKTYKVSCFTPADYMEQIRAECSPKYIYINS